ncbi:hypothetical protein [Aquisalinus flavus]|uniref:Yip1 domain-containing protein n=1 Tax=Aquisalinus flavus TaxID=1526572 RepID=A0A8J2Y710_9PROT|nr:hypothetical protein [Aquisalinus flavus]MBD0425296.1 hypothetical protein [Aquisalinus flavus]UNE49051.1 hypothetical protein FF099_13815 [Aquisalinus flavus]GGD17191.1 hypothetical protein GCM10011342_27480 [Aquisalinus flavus]
MITPAYIGSQFRAVLAMARNNPLWRERLDAGADGFYRSLWAVLLGLPVAALILYLSLLLILEIPDFAAEMTLALPLPLLMVVQMLTVAAIRVALIAMLIVLSRSLNKERGMSPLVVAYNWGELMTQLLLALTLILILLTPSPASFAGLLLGVTIFMFYIRWGVLRRALDINIVQTISILVMLSLIGFLVSIVVTGVLRGFIGLFMPLDMVPVDVYFARD